MRAHQSSVEAYERSKMSRSKAGAQEGRSLSHKEDARIGS
jgi:hypothetical protein